MKISAGTAARTIWLAVALLNQVLIILGKEVIPFAEDDIYQVTSLIFTAAAAIAAWWKNNSFTKAAKEADLLMKQMKTQN
ncbi:MAG: phage holin [Clostridia bacterium]|nr:phage holin [Clostridia bacterium]